jgi:hypothetical protein
MQQDLHQVEQRVRRYWYSDGIGELICGGMFVLLGVYFALQEYLGEDSPLTAILQASMVLLFIGGAFIARWLVNAMKTRLTYPRTGYVEYRAPQRNPRARGIVVLGVGMAVAVGAVLTARLLGSPDLIVAMTGILFGAVLAATAGRSTGLARFYVLGGISFTLGVILSFSGIPQGYALGLFYGLMGVAAILSGALVLGRYLRENPIPPEAPHGR